MIWCNFRVLISLSVTTRGTNFRDVFFTALVLFGPPTLVS